MIVEVIGVLIGAVIQGLIVSQFTQSNPCVLTTTTATLSTELIINSNPSTTSFNQTLTGNLDGYNKIVIFVFFI